MSEVESKLNMETDVDIHSLDCHFDALSDVLSQEREALLSGKFELLEEYAKQKTSLCDALEARAPNQDAGVAPERMRKLQSEIKRNEALIEGARKGVEMARRRLIQLAKKASEIGVYDASGDRPQMSDASKARGRCA